MRKKKKINNEGRRRQAAERVRIEESLRRGKMNRTFFGDFRGNEFGRYGWRKTHAGSPREAACIRFSL
jgi:hypothetical protein